MKLCKCDQGARNTGQPNCIGTRGRTVGFVFVDYTDSDGNINFIPKGQSMTDVFINGKINETKDKRWNFLSGFKNVDQPVADPTTQTFDGVNEKVEDGVETFTGVRTDGSGDPEFKAIIDSRECIKTGFWEITINGELVGEKDPNGNLAPILIELGTTNIKYVKPTQAAKQMLEFTFAVAKTVYAGDYQYISSDQFESPLLGFISLQDIASSASGISTTGVTITLTSEFGAWDEQSPFVGLLLGDWVVNNVTDQLPIALITAVETIPGESGIYDLTYLAQDSSDVIDYDFVKAGFELTEKPSTYITP